MKNKSNRTLQFTIGLILAFWLFTLVKAVFVEHELSVTTNELFVKIFVLKFSMLAIICLLMKFGGVSFFDLGFSGQRILPQILRGMGFAILAFAIINIVLNVFLLTINPVQENPGGVNMAIHFKERRHLFAWLLVAIFGGGFVEELERIFVLTRFENWLGNKGLYLAVILSMVVFGTGHLYQGTNGAISAAFSGLIFALVYLRKRSAIEAVTCHAVFDIIGITAAHFLMN